MLESLPARDVTLGFHLRIATKRPRVLVGAGSDVSLFRPLRESNSHEAICASASWGGPPRGRTIRQRLRRRRWLSLGVLQTWCTPSIAPACFAIFSSLLNLCYFPVVTPVSCSQILLLPACYFQLFTSSRNRKQRKALQPGSCRVRERRRQRLNIGSAQGKAGTSSPGRTAICSSGIFAAKSPRERTDRQMRQRQ